MGPLLTPIPSSSLRVTGADRVDFVHGQMTADLRGTPAPGYVAGCFLSVKGRIEQFARIYRRVDDIYIHLDEGQAPELLARLQRYVIFDQVELQDLSSDLRTVHLWGEVPAGLPVLETAGAAWALEWAGANVLLGAVKRSGRLGLDMHYLAREEGAVLEALYAAGAAPQPWETLQAARVAAGLPDPVPDHFLGYLPQEVGLDASGPLPAISYRKGCYVGQEVMARLEARGQARYGLALLQVPSGLPAGSEVMAGGKPVGQTGLEAGGLALARLHLDLLGDAALTAGGEQVTRADA